MRDKSRVVAHDNSTVVRCLMMWILHDILLSPTETITGSWPRHFMGDPSADLGWSAGGRRLDKGSPKDSRKLSPAADMSAPVSGRATMVQVPFGVLMFACTVGALEAWVDAITLATLERWWRLGGTWEFRCDKHTLAKWPFLPHFEHVRLDAGHWCLSRCVDPPQYFPWTRLTGTTWLVKFAVLACVSTGSACTTSSTAFLLYAICRRVCWAVFCKLLFHGYL